MSFPILKVQFIRTLVKFEALSKLIGCYNFFHIICIYTFFTAVVQRLKSQIFFLYIDYYHPSSFLSRIKRDVNFFLNAFNHIFTPYVLYTGRNNFVRLASCVRAEDARAARFRIYPKRTSHSIVIFSRRSPLIERSRAL